MTKIVSTESPLSWQEMLRALEAVLHEDDALTDATVLPEGLRPGPTSTTDGFVRSRVGDMLFSAQDESGNVANMQITPEVIERLGTSPAAGFVQRVFDVAQRERQGGRRISLSPLSSRSRLARRMLRLQAERDPEVTGVATGRARMGRDTLTAGAVGELAKTVFEKHFAERFDDVVCGGTTGRLQTDDYDGPDHTMMALVKAAVNPDAEGWAQFYVTDFDGTSHAVEVHVMLDSDTKRFAALLS